MVVESDTVQVVLRNTELEFGWVMPGGVGAEWSGVWALKVDAAEDTRSVK